MPSSGVQTCADRKSTRLNSSHTIISYAVFCLKKKTQQVGQRTPHTPTRPAPRPATDPRARACGPGGARGVGGGGWHVSRRRPRAFFFLIIGRPPRSPLFPSTTLSR